jgi:hypothetical protein
MKLMKTILLLPVVAALSTACDRSDKSEVGALPAPDAAPAQNGPLIFVAMESSDNTDAIKVRCAIDRLNAQKANAQTISVEAGGDLRFKGWVSDPAKRVPAQFTIVLAGPATYGVSAVAGIRRPDVARSLKAKDLANSGFDVLAALGPVAAGEYAVSIVEDVGGKTALCATSTRVVVTGSPG